VIPTKISIKRGTFFRTPCISESKATSEWNWKVIRDEEVARRALA